MWSYITAWSTESHRPSTVTGIISRPLHQVLRERERKRVRDLYILFDISIEFVREFQG